MFPFFNKPKPSSSPKKKKSGEQASDLATPPSASPARKSNKAGRQRQSGSVSPRAAKSPTKSSLRALRKSSFDVADTHPLNLPPEEREKRRSALAYMSEPRDSMEIDSPSEAPPSSPPGSFPTSNGVEHTEDVSQAGPIPPPHRKQSEAHTPTSPPIDAEACKAAGNKFFKMRDYDKAIKEYTKAIEADPQNPTYLSNRSAAFMSACRFSEALEDAKLADEMEPGNSKVVLRLARIYTALGRPSEAVELYNNIDPPVADKDKLPALSMKNYIKQAEDVLKEGIAGSMALHALDMADRGLGVGVDRPRKWKLLRGEAYLRMGNVNALGDAQNIAMSLLRQNNKDPEALVLRGRALYAQGENEKAVQHFREALNCDPDYKDAVKYLRMVQKLEKIKEEGNQAYKLGRMQAAVDLYGAALEIDPQNKGTNSKILQNRALALIKVMLICHVILGRNCMLTFV